MVWCCRCNRSSADAKKSGAPTRDRSELTEYVETFNPPARPRPDPMRSHRVIVVELLHFGFMTFTRVLALFKLLIIRDIRRRERDVWQLLRFGLHCHWPNWLQHRALKALKAHARVALLDVLVICSVRVDGVIANLSMERLAHAKRPSTVRISVDGLHQIIGQLVINRRRARAAIHRLTTQHLLLELVGEVARLLLARAHRRRRLRRPQDRHSPVGLAKPLGA